MPNQRISQHRQPLEAADHEVAQIFARWPLAEYPVTLRESHMWQTAWELGRLAYRDAVAFAAASPTGEAVAVHNLRVEARREATERHGKAWADLVAGGGDAA